MKILIVGKGGREHAMLEACRKSSLVDEIFVLPGNCGMKNCNLVDIDMYDIEKVKNFALEKNIDLTIVGSADVLALGIKDEFEKVGLKLFGPTKSATRIESSRYFSKQLMEKLKIPTVDYVVFTDKEQALKYVSNLEEFPILIKLDELTKGEGTVLSRTNRTAVNIVERIFSENENAKILIEKFERGKEFSIFAFVKDKNVFPIDIVKDYKRALDDEQGENTGGMGACSPVSNITDEEVDKVVEKILKPMAKSMFEDGYGFEGFLYGDIISTKEGIKVLGINARLGDPEAEVLLPKFESDFVQNILDTMNGETPNIKISKDAFLGVVLASAGYPSEQRVQDKIDFKEVESNIYFMGVEKRGNEYFAKGGRNLIFVSCAKNLEEARKKVYSDIEKFKNDSFFFRTDIGKF